MSSVNKIKVFSITAALFLLFGVTSCNNTADSSHEEKEQMEKEVVEAVNATENYFESEKKETIMELEKSRDAVKERFEKIQIGLKESGEEIASDVQKSIDFTKEKMTELDSKIEEMKSTTKAAFEQTKESTKSIADEIKKELDKIETTMKQN